MALPQAPLVPASTSDGPSRRFFRWGVASVTSVTGPAEPSVGSRPTGLRGRRSECKMVDELLEGLRAGRSGALVVHGEPGIGKTELLEYAIDSASDLRDLRAVGVESELELAFAALHQLCAPMLDRLERLPGPQRDALSTVFGLSAGPAPERLLVGLAVLSLLSEAAEERPLLCIVDDAQWLDQASAQALTFVARRLFAEPVVMLFAARETSDEFRGLPEAVLEGLRDEDACELLRSAVPGPLDERVRDQIVAETRGNPLALLELPRGLSPAQLAGGFGLPAVMRGARSLSGRGGGPGGHPVWGWGAGAGLGTAGGAAAPAETAGLLEIGGRVRFRHP